MDRPKIIVATGIPACGHKEYLKKLVTYANNRAKRTKVFHVGEMMFALARSIGLDLNRNNILHADRDLLNTLRSGVFNEIKGEIAANTASYDAFVIEVHTFFWWGERYLHAFDRFMHLFSPDLYITFINEYSIIFNQIIQREQWKDQGLTKKKIMEWQGLEIETTSGFADMANKGFFAVPVTASPSLLYRLIFHPEIEPVYSAMPISHFTDPKDREVIDRFVQKLDQYFSVFNPLSIEVVGAIDTKKTEIKEDEDAALHYIIYRDLDWFVRRVKAVVVFWPERPVPEEIKADKKLAKLWPKDASSPGIDHETHEAFFKTKDVWMVCEGRKISPFVSHFCTKYFSSAKEFFQFLENKYPERKELLW